MRKEISFFERHAATDYWGMEYFFSATQLTPVIFRGKRILNLGAGRVNLQEELAQRGVNDCAVVSLDMAYTTSRKPWWRKYPKIPREGIPENAVSGDIKKLPFADNSFDIAIATYSLIPYIGGSNRRTTEVIKAIKETMRVSNETFILPCSEYDYESRFKNAFPGFTASHRQPTYTSIKMPGALHIAHKV